jgi:hypothetical protein
MCGERKRKYRPVTKTCELSGKKIETGRLTGKQALFPFTGSMHS